MAQNGASRRGSYLIVGGLAASIGFAGGLTLGLSGVFNDTSAGTAFLEGRPEIHDGDTFKIERDGYHHPVRVWGIDTPELKQECVQGKKTVKCGEMSRDALIELVGDKTVSCDFKGYSLGRVVASCRVDGQDLGRLMVQSGWALAEKHSKYHYQPEEDDARKHKRGLWQMTFQIPDEWRKCKNTPDPTVCRAGVLKPKTAP